MGREFHSFAPLNEKEFCALASLNLGRDRLSVVAWWLSCCGRSPAQSSEGFPPF